MELYPIEQTQREEVDAFIIQQWYTPQMVLHGEIIDLREADGWYAVEQDEIIGLITYRVIAGQMEILSLDSLCEKHGVGTALLDQAVKAARGSKLQRITLITTNDNLPALRFYQKRGFDMVGLYRNAVDVSRKIKPEIPRFGLDGIPLKHEIELEMQL